MSQNFLASRFIAEKELPPLLKAAREEGITVFWIYFSSCLFEQTEIGSYQAAHDISRPLDHLSKSQRQAALSSVCAKLIRAAEGAEPLLDPIRVVSQAATAGRDPGPRGFELTEFSPLEELSLVSSARVDGHILRITPSAPFKNGAAWASTRQYVQYGFDTIFEFKLTAQDQYHGGGDGLAFVIQNSDAGAIGGFGASLGFGTDTGFNVPGIPNSLAVVLDTFQNTEAPFNDPSGNHVAVHSNGDNPNNTFSITRIADAALTSINFKDGNVHSVEVNCVPEALEVLIDARLILTVSLNLASMLRLADGKAFVGFTAATASSFQNHDILSWAFRSRPARV